MEWSDKGATGWVGDVFQVRHVPPLRLVILGHGGGVEALADLARGMGIDHEIFTPDEDLAHRLRADGAAVRVLRTPRDIDAVKGDPWTAFTFFFHDHDWEPWLLGRALSQPSLFIGAMGSRNTHEKRLRILEEAQVAASDRSRIVSPIGLIPSSRDPETLALSALAQVVECYNRRFGANGDLS